MDKKQNVIKEAYGEHWDTVKNNVNENGYLYHPKGGEVTFSPFIGLMDEHSTEDAYRPKSLSGIENNNGWISIESESDLPNESERYWVIRNGVVDIGIYSKSYDKWLCSGQYFFATKGDLKITHYQIIQKPKPPIY